VSGITDLIQLVSWQKTTGRAASVSRSEVTTPVRDVGSVPEPEAKTKCHFAEALQAFAARPTYKRELR
jgi:hypothetical protein